MNVSMYACNADNAALTILINTGSSSHQVDWTNFVFLFSQVRNGYSGWFIEGSLRWLNRHDWTYKWQRRFGFERLCDHFIRHWQNLDADNDSNAFTGASEGNDAQATENSYLS